ncbi:serine/threonine-protein kinase PknD [Mycobacterium simiae]|uniref:serine/threonine-protein kinase PknD n=1 Tax=Mycobacterium simiae TaxID=1784 RepID=UPI0004299527|nr:serine/threonine-protein kinase PknD [Mycobacterium simiae]PLV48673.1 serine/threonine protein kinase [Mycobacterium tuberculosis variant microti OV254]BBX43453.1 serine/threonine-protein kinase PknD [Mycobacterium simiae]
MTVDDTVSRPRARFGPFQLIRLMDHGAMGEVYEAQDTHNHRVVMLKLISQEFSNDAIFRARMHHEADTPGRQTDAHIVPIHECGDVDGQCYVALPMIRGTSLRTLLMDHGPLTPAQAVAVVGQIAAALDTAHARGVTYHDVKPENILVAEDYFAYLLDFGIADAISDLTMTESKTAVGTYNYMAPEWFTDGEIGYPADIYALACVLSECLTAIPCYLADSVEQLVAMQLAGPAPRPSQLQPEIMPALDSVVAKGTAPDPAERYRTAENLAVAAHDALTTSVPRQEADLGRHDNEIRLNEALAADTKVNYTSSGTEPQTIGATTSQPSHSGDATGDRPGARNTDTEDLRASKGELPLSAPHFPPWWTQTPAMHADSWRTQPPATSIHDRPFLAMQPRGRRKLWAILGAVGILGVVTIVVAGFLISSPSPPSQQASSSQQPPRQTVLPFRGLNFRLSPGGVAVDNSGTVYVTNQGMYGRVVALAAGSSTPNVELFRGLYEPQGLAVDSAGTLYVSDFNNRVVMLAAGSSSQVELPFTGLSYPEGVAVDDQGSVYVADRGNNRVVKLPAGSTSQVVLPFNGLNNPDGVAVDKTGNVYVTDTDNSRAVRLDAGSNNQTVLPFPRLASPWGITVHSTGDVFVTERDTNDVVELAAGSSTPTTLPFTDLNTPLSVAVDKAGNVYVANRGDDSVLKLAP